MSNHFLTPSFKNFKLWPFEPMSLTFELSSSLLCYLMSLDLYCNVVYCILVVLFSNKWVSSSLVQVSSLLSFTSPNIFFFLSLCPMKWSFCHATLDTPCHSAVAVQCFMDSVPSLNFLLSNHVCHTRLPFHYPSSLWLTRIKRARQTPDWDR